MAATYNLLSLLQGQGQQASSPTDPGLLQALATAQQYDPNASIVPTQQTQDGAVTGTTYNVQYDYSKLPQLPTGTQQNFLADAAAGVPGVVGSNAAQIAPRQISNANDTMNPLLGILTPSSNIGPINEAQNQAQQQGGVLGGLVDAMTPNSPQKFAIMLATMGLGAAGLDPLTTFLANQGISTAASGGKNLQDPVGDTMTLGKLISILMPQGGP